MHDFVLSDVRHINFAVRLLCMELPFGPIKAGHPNDASKDSALIWDRTKFKAGQWLDLYVPDHEKPGGFTITSPPLAAAPPTMNSTPPILELAVQDRPENAVAAWLWRPVDQIVGSRLRGRIGGSFIFPPEASLGGLQGIDKVVFIAGGLGINPVMSILRFIGETSHQYRLEIVVIYSSKIPRQDDPGGILFVQSIAALFSSGLVRGRFKIHLTGDTVSLTSECRRLGMTGLDVRAGRISRMQLEEELDSNNCLMSAMFYVCGPPPMTDAIVGTLTSSPPGLGVPASRIRTERWW